MNYGKKSTQKREKELTSKSTMIRKKFYVIFCKSLLVCVFAVMVIGACSGVGVIRGIIASAPTIDDIVATPTGFLSTVLDANGNQTATLVASGSNRRAVTIDEIPKNLQHAFVAIEDERFYEHNGIRELEQLLPAGGCNRYHSCRRKRCRIRFSFLGGCQYHHAAAFEKYRLYQLDKRIFHG